MRVLILIDQWIGWPRGLAQKSNYQVALKALEVKSGENMYKLNLHGYQFWLVETFNESTGQVHSYTVYQYKNNRFIKNWLFYCPSKIRR
jgi:hypothetical protein